MTRLILHQRPRSRVVVEFPFTDASPTMLPEGGQALDKCKKIIDGLHPATREALLMNLCSVYAEERR